MRKDLSRGMTPIRGRDLVALVDAYLVLAQDRVGGKSRNSVIVPRILEWRADGVTGSGAWPLDAFGLYGTGVQRLSSPSAGVTKASPKK